MTSSKDISEVIAGLRESLCDFHPDDAADVRALLDAYAQVTQERDRARELLWSSARAQVDHLIAQRERLRAWNAEMRTALEPFGRPDAWRDYAGACRVCTREECEHTRAWRALENSNDV